MSDVETVNFDAPVLPAKRRSLDNLRSWKKGESGNPGGRRSYLLEFQERLRANEPAVVDELVKLIKGSKDEYLRLAAIHEFFDRLYGKPKQSIANESEDGKPAIAIQILANEMKY